MFSKLGAKISSDQKKTRKTKPSLAGTDFLSSWTELQLRESEAEELKKKCAERKEYLETLERRIEDLKKENADIYKPEYSHEAFLKDKEAKVSLKRVKREMKGLREKEAKVERLKEEYAEMTARKETLLCEVQKHSVYKDFMAEVLKLTRFEDVDALTGYFESLLHFRDQLYQKENQVQEQVDQQRRVLLTLEDQHNLLFLQKNNQLAHLQTELDRVRAEALIWDRRWSHIQETAAKKTLELGLIKMATLNLYESTGGVVGPEGVDINDTERQLEQIKSFIKDQKDIMKQYQVILQRKTDEENREAKPQSDANDK
ncbi:coiled-coil domain-containing protein 42 like-2-like [Menidia menidia]